MLTANELREVAGSNPDWVLANVPQNFLPKFICQATYCNLTCFRLPFEQWDQALESNWGPWCMLSFLLIVFSCVGRGFATRWSTVKGVLTYVYKQDLETQATGVLRSHWPEGAVNRPVSISGNVASKVRMVAMKNDKKFWKQLSCPNRCNIYCVCTLTL
jgi:hypothetical protein